MVGDVQSSIRGMYESFVRKRRKKRFEWLLHCASFGPYGGREISDPLMIVKTWM